MKVGLFGKKNSVWIEWGALFKRIKGFFNRIKGSFDRM